MLLLLILIEIRKWLIQKKLSGFTSPKQLPIIGVAGRFFNESNIANVIINLYDEVGKTPMQAWFGPMLVVGISEPEDIQIVLTNDNCLNKPYFYEKFKCKTSILVVKKETWKPFRRALNPIFNLNMLQTYAPLINAKSKILCQKLEMLSNKSDVDIFRPIFISIIDMILKTTMGSEQNVQTTETGEHLYELGKTMMTNIQYRIARLWLKWDFTYALTKVYRDEQTIQRSGQQLLDAIIANKIKEFDRLKCDGIDYLSDVNDKKMTNLLEKCLILERDGFFNRRNTIDNIRSILFAGVDTSSFTVYATLLMLAIHPNFQQLVVDELKSIFDTADSDVTLKDINDMKYLECCIRETMRLCPPVPFVTRYSTAEVQLSSGIIPKNTNIHINVFHTHRNPKIWGANANEFDPERFLPEYCAKRHPYSYIPFLAGPRNCIGMKYAWISAKIMLAHLLRQYQFSSYLTLPQIRFKMHIALELINENPIHIKKRVF